MQLPLRHCLEVYCYTFSTVTNIDLQHHISCAGRSLELFTVTRFCLLKAYQRDSERPNSMSVEKIAGLEKKAPTALWQFTKIQVTYYCGKSYKRIDCRLSSETLW